MTTKNVKLSATVNDNKKLLSELHSSTSKVVLDSATKDALKNETKSVTEQSKSATKSATVKDIKDYISSKTEAQLLTDKRAVVRQHRYYMIQKSSTDSDKYNVFNRTMFTDTDNVQKLLTADIARRKTLEYIQKLKLQTQFSAQDIMRLLNTIGGAFGDTIRNALYEQSLYVNSEKDAQNKDIIAKAVQLKKTCVYYNACDTDSRRKRYYFVRVA